MFLSSFVFLSSCHILEAPENMLHHFNTLNFLILFIQSSRPHSKITNRICNLWDIPNNLFISNNSFLLFDFKNQIFGSYLGSATPSPYYEGPVYGESCIWYEYIVDTLLCHTSIIRLMYYLQYSLITMQLYSLITHGNQKLF